jgi:hypothetical protein
LNKKRQKCQKGKKVKGYKSEKKLSVKRRIAAHAIPFGIGWDLNPKK